MNNSVILKVFINIFKNSDVKTITTSAKIIVIITVKNTVIQNTLNRQIANTKKMNVKICKTFPLFKRYFKKGFFGR